MIRILDEKALTRTEKRERLREGEGKKKTRFAENCFKKIHKFYARNFTSEKVSKILEEQNLC